MLPGMWIAIVIEHETNPPWCSSLFPLRSRLRRRRIGAERSAILHRPIPHGLCRREVSLESLRQLRQRGLPLVVRVAQDSLTVPKATFDALAKPVVPGETILVGTGSKGAMDRNPGFVYEVSSIETVGTDVVIRGQHVPATHTFVGPLSNATPPPNAKKNGLGLKTEWQDSVTLVSIGSESEEHVIDFREKLGIPASKTTRAGEVTNVAQIVYKYWASASASYLVDVQLPGLRSCGPGGWGRCPTGFNVKQVDVALHATAGAAARLEMSTGIAANKDWDKTIPLVEVPLNCGIPCSIRAQLVLKCGVGWAAGATFNSTDAKVSGQIDIGVKKEGGHSSLRNKILWQGASDDLNGEALFQRDTAPTNLRLTGTILREHQRILFDHS